MAHGTIDVAADYTSRFIVSAVPEGARRVLEIGCGQGEVAATLGRHGLSVLAIDSDAEAVSAARSRGVDAHVASWPDVSLRRFDAVIFTRSLHHIAPLDEAVSAALSCLAPGGRIIVEDFAHDEAPEPALRWFRGIADIVLKSGCVAPPGSGLAEMIESGAAIGRWWQSAHDHDLHGADAIETALRDAGCAVGAERSAYYFRYLAEATGAASPLLAAALRHEEEMIGFGLIAPLGRRFIAAHDL